MLAHLEQTHLFRLKESQVLYNEKYEGAVMMSLSIFFPILSWETFYLVDQVTMTVGEHGSIK